MTKKKILALTMALMLAVTLPLAVLAEVYDLAQGSITVEAKADGNQYVSQAGGVQQEQQTTETVINQTGSDTASTNNTITIQAEKNQTAQVTISDVNINVSRDSKAAISTGGDGSVTIELDGDNTAKSGTYHAGVEKNNGGNLTITDADGDGALNAKGGAFGAGIGGGIRGSGSDITISGNAEVTAIGGGFGAGIGGGNLGNGSDITISGNAKVEASGGDFAASIGGGNNGTGKDVTISTEAQVKVPSGWDGAAIGDGDNRNGEITPNTDNLTNGFVAYYAPDADKSKEAPEKLLHNDGSGAHTHTGVTLKSSTAATCLNNATVTYLCSCGTEITTELLNTALGHKLGEYTSNNDATCMADGTKTAHCTNPGCTYSETLPDAGTALGHKLGEYISDNNATCTADGTKTAKCIRYGKGGCQESKTVTDEGSKLEHKFDPYVPDNNATCTENDTETAKCAYGCGAEDTREIPDSKLPHEYGSYVYQDDATCTADGTEIAQCKHCDATDTRTAEGTMLAHSFTHYVSNGDATYDSDGTKTAECDYGCGATDTIPDEGSKLTLYRVTDEAGKSVVYKSNYSGSTLTITAEYDYATLTGTVAALRHLQGKGIETIVFKTNGATSTFNLADVTEAGVYALTHDAENVAFLLNGEDIGSILK